VNHILSINRQVRYKMGTALTIAAYVCLAVFLWRVLWRIVLHFRISARTAYRDRESSGPSSVSVLRAVRDVLFLTRLFRTNKLLWAGEWIFHVAFLVVALRHLRYFLYPVPEWIVDLQSAGIYAGYILPLALIYIAVVKTVVERKSYFSSYNFFLLAVLLMICVSGIVLTDFMRTDLVDVKYFMLSALALSPAPAPESTPFIIHFSLTLIFLASLPAHIIAAPFTMLEARKREDSLHRIMHER
jgi:nitrate reductase gamma subunit